MKSNQNSNRADETLNSFDGIQRATPTPFLFTRVMARMQATKDSVWEKAVSFISRPSLAIAGLSLIIALNVIVITVNHSKEMAVKAQGTDYLSLNNNTGIDNITNTAP